MNAQNQHLSETLAAASECFHRLVELQVTILDITIAGRNPVIRIHANDHVKQRYGAGLHLTKNDHGKTIEIHVTVIAGCQVEWEIPRH